MKTMIRLILLGLALFLAAKIIGSLVRPTDTQEVKGEAKKKSLDISEGDIEDVDFKEKE